MQTPARGARSSYLCAPKNFLENLKNPTELESGFAIFSPESGESPIHRKSPPSTSRPTGSRSPSTNRFSLQQRSEFLKGVKTVMKKTIKVRLVLENKADEAKFSRTMEQYRQACNFVSQYMFDHDFPMNQFELQKAIYRDIRDRFGLKAQMAISAILTTIARYKTVRGQMLQDLYICWDEYTQKPYLFQIDLEWLESPIHFRRLQVDLARGRGWSKRADGTLSINTLDGRVIAKPMCRNFEKYFDGTWKFGTAKLLRKNGCWMLYINATKERGRLDASKPATHKIA